MDIVGAGPGEKREDVIFVFLSHLMVTYPTLPPIGTCRPEGMKREGGREGGRKWVLCVCVQVAMCAVREKREGRRERDERERGGVYW